MLERMRAQVDLPSALRISAVPPSLLLLKRPLHNNKPTNATPPCSSRISQSRQILPAPLSLFSLPTNVYIWLSDLSLFALYFFPYDSPPLLSASLGLVPSTISHLFKIGTQSLYHQTTSKITIEGWHCFRALAAAAAITKKIVGHIPPHDR